MSNLRLGVVGVGALGKHHARILAGMDGVELAAVADVRAETAQTIASQYGCPAFGDSAEMLDRVEAAVIAVPTFAHLAVAREFLQRRIPVLVEKPLAMNLAECRQLVELADTNGTLLQVGHIEQFNPAYRTARLLTDSPKYIRAERYSPFAFRSMDIGVVLDVMIHDIDLVLDLVRSPVRRVEAFGLSILGRQEDSVQARLTFDSGCIADLSASRVHPSTQRSLQIVSLDGAVSVDLQAREVACYRKSDRLKFGPSPLELAVRPDADMAKLKDAMFGGFITIDRPAVPVADALTDELHSFITCVQTGRPPQVGGREALAAMWTAEEILHRVAAHQWDATPAGRTGPHAIGEDQLRRAA